MAAGDICPQTIRQCILEKTQARGAEKTICPSEVARELGGNDWRSLMDSVRQAGIALVDADKILVTQKGKVVDPHIAKGPIRYRLKAKR
ncbi:DUF3253 domain-containing protein [Vacuolonema iberomarrocanum]|uniref:DUF3253 domain-containing protein n=1 Tax=Vacuolonema iberomarrocanum TaxID=3454632 RepID=UPI0019EF5F07|nr:DUF3253 domain-containing protein [filamentous cyanobacterium LEGE 07170]